MGFVARMDHALSVRLAAWTNCPSASERICLAMRWHSEAGVLNVEDLLNMVVKTPVNVLRMLNKALWPVNRIVATFVSVWL